jgi:hypothetical protein
MSKSGKRINICSILAVLVDGIVLLRDNVVYPLFRTPDKTPQQRCGDKLVSQTYSSSFQRAFASSEPYVSQKLVESELSRAIGRAGHNYLVVVGPTGVGKSAIVNHVMSNKQGIIGLQLIHDNHNLFQGIINTICGDKRESIPSTLEVMSNIFENAIAMKRKETNSDDWVPTVVIEIDGSSEFAVNQIAGYIKHLCVDRQLCRSILILSDDTVVFSLRSDPYAKLVWVDDLTRAEASWLYDELHFHLSQGHESDPSSDVCLSTNNTLKNRIFDELGTRAIDLLRLYSDIKHDNITSLDDHFNARANRCGRILCELLAVGSMNGMDFEILVIEILRSENKSVWLSSLPMSVLVISEQSLTHSQEASSFALPPSFEFLSILFQVYGECGYNLEASSANQIKGNEHWTQHSD